MWFHDVTQDHANSNAQAGTPQNQITFKMSLLRDKWLQVGVDPDILHANGSKLVHQLCTYTNTFLY